MERTRTRAFDAVRITAVLCVVLTHTIQNELHLFPDAAFPAANAVWVLAMVCNPLYVMLSGALLAGPREESIPWFFWKRFTGAALPMAVYYLLTAGGRQIVVRPEDGTGFWGLVRNLFTGNTPEAPQLWLVYLILSLYLAVPLVRLLLSKISWGAFSIVIWSLFAITCLMAGAALAEYCGLFIRAGLAFPGADNPMFFRTLISSRVYTWLNWLLIFLMGYWVRCPQSRRYDIALKFAGLVSVNCIAAMAASNHDQAFAGMLCCNCAPLAVMACLMIFAVFINGKYEDKQEINTRENADNRTWEKMSLIAGFIRRLLIRHNYGIILVHWAVMIMVTGRILGLSAVSFGIVGGVLLCATSTLAFSAAAAAVIDNLIVHPLQKLLKNLIKTDSR